MEDLIASIRDKRGATTPLDWIRGAPADTQDIAARFSMQVDDVRKLMKRLERQGLVRSRKAAWSGYGSGGMVLVWEATGQQ